MIQDETGRLVKFIELTVRNDKDQGILIEKFSADNDDYFFKPHQQAIHKHFLQVQQIVKAAKVQRTKKIRIEISSYMYEYYRGDIPTFKGCRLISANQQMAKVGVAFVNKDIGAMKRAVTVQQNKQIKVDESNNKIVNKMMEAERQFQELRAKRIAEVFGRRDSQTARNDSSNSTDRQIVDYQTPSTSSQAQVPRIIPTVTVTAQDPSPPSLSEDATMNEHSDTDF